MEPGSARPAGGDGDLVPVAGPDGTWWVDLDFLASSWRCRWGDGCLGIGDQPDPEAGLGCCSVGAQILDAAEAATVAALAATLEPSRFEHHDEAASGGVLVPDRTATRVVDGACIFLNRPGFAGGAGCALHLAAVADGERPLDWKPAVCWQLPLKVERGTGADGRPEAVLRRWRRTDWGPGGATMHWCCTEGDLAYDGEAPVVDSLAAELVELVGPEVHVALRRRVADDAGPPADPAP